MPHWATILTSALSPALALMALYLSKQSLETSQQAMKVGQRAYLTVTKTSTESKLNPSLATKYSFDKNDSEYPLWVSGKFTVLNLGNTPAKVLSFYTKIYFFSESQAPYLGFGPSGERMSIVIPRPISLPLEIPSRADREIPFFEEVRFPKTLFEELRFLSNSKGITKEEMEAITFHNFEFSLVFADVFNEKHQLSWSADQRTVDLLK